MKSQRNETSWIPRSRRSVLFYMLGTAIILVLDRSVSVANAPRVLCKLPVVNVGRIQYLGAVEATYVIANNGDSALNLAIEPPPCNCTGAFLTSPQVAPGKEATVRITYGPKTFGHFEGEVYVRTNDTENPRLRLAITGFVESGVICSPTELKFRTYLAEQSSQWLSIQGPEDLQIRKVETNSTFLSASISRTSTSESTKSYSVNVSVTPPSGYLGDKFYEVDLNTSYGMIKVPVELEVMSNITVNPDPIFIGFIDSGKKMQREVSVSHRLKRKFRILDAHIDPQIDGQVKVQNLDEPAEKWPIIITIQTERKGPFQSVLMLSTDLENEPIRTIKLVGYVR